MGILEDGTFPQDLPTAGNGLRKQVVGPSNLTDQLAEPGEYNKGLALGWQGVKSNTEGFVAGITDVFAPDAAAKMFEHAKANMEVVQRNNQLKTQNLTDVNSVGSFGDWFAGAAGQGTPTIATGLVTGGVGGLVGKGLLRAGMTNAAKVAGPAGFVGGILPQEAGETAMNLQADPLAMENTTPAERAAIMLGKGTVNTALEAAPVAHALGLASKGVSGATRSLPNVLKAAGQGAATTGIAEGVTEGTQNLVGDAAMMAANPEHNFDFKAALNAAAAGFAPGSVMGGTSAAVGAIKNRPAEAGEPVKKSWGDRLGDAVAGSLNVAGKMYEKGAAYSQKKSDKIGAEQIGASELVDRMIKKNYADNDSVLKDSDTFVEAMGTLDKANSLQRNEDLSAATIKYHAARASGDRKATIDAAYKLHDAVASARRIGKFSRMADKLEGKKSAMTPDDIVDISNYKAQFTGEDYKNFINSITDQFPQIFPKPESAYEAKEQMRAKLALLKYAEDGYSEELPDHIADVLGEHASTFIGDLAKKSEAQGFTDIATAKKGIRLSRKLEAGGKVDADLGGFLVDHLAPLGKSLAKELRTPQALTNRILKNHHEAEDIRGQIEEASKLLTDPKNGLLEIVPKDASEASILKRRIKETRDDIAALSKTLLDYVADQDRAFGKNVAVVGARLRKHKQQRDSAILQAGDEVVDSGAKNENMDDDGFGKPKYDEDNKIVSEIKGEAKTKYLGKGGVEGAKAFYTSPDDLDGVNQKELDEAYERTLSETGYARNAKIVGAVDRIKEEYPEPSKVFVKNRAALTPEEEEAIAKREAVLQARRDAEDALILDKGTKAEKAAVTPKKVPDGLAHNENNTRRDFIDRLLNEGATEAEAEAQWLPQSLSHRHMYTRESRDLRTAALQRLNKQLSFISVAENEHDDELVFTASELKYISFDPMPGKDTAEDGVLIIGQNSSKGAKGEKSQRGQFYVNVGTLLKLASAKVNAFGAHKRGGIVTDKNIPTQNVTSREGAREKIDLINAALSAIIDTKGGNFNGKVGYIANAGEEITWLNDVGMEGRFKHTPEFSKLPAHNPAKRTKTYAGIGSRETPSEYRRQMSAVAKYLEKHGYTLRTGDADGADAAFSDSVDRKQVFTAKHANERTMKIAAEVHPDPRKLKPFPLKLMARNTNQIFGMNLNSVSDFVLCWTPDGAETREARSYSTGGTGQAIDMAYRKGVPVINMANKNWKEKLKAVLKGEYSTGYEGGNPVDGGNAITFAERLPDALRLGSGVSMYDYRILASKEDAKAKREAARGAEEFEDGEDFFATLGESNEAEAEGRNPGHEFINGNISRTAVEDDGGDVHTFNQHDGTPVDPITPRFFNPEKIALSTLGMSEAEFAKHPELKKKWDDHVALWKRIDEGTEPAAKMAGKVPPGEDPKEYNAKLQKIERAKDHDLRNNEALWAGIPSTMAEAKALYKKRRDAWRDAPADERSALAPHFPMRKLEYIAALNNIRWYESQVQEQASAAARAEARRDAAHSRSGDDDIGITSNPYVQKHVPELIDQSFMNNEARVADISKNLTKDRIPAAGSKNPYLPTSKDYVPLSKEEMLNEFGLVEKKGADGKVTYVQSGKATKTKTAARHIAEMKEGLNYFVLNLPRAVAVKDPEALASDKGRAQNTSREEKPEVARPSTRRRPREVSVGNFDVSATPRGRAERMATVGTKVSSATEADLRGEKAGIAALAEATKNWTVKLSDEEHRKIYKEAFNKGRYPTTPVVEKTVSKPAAKEAWEKAPAKTSAQLIAEAKALLGKSSKQTPSAELSKDDVAKLEAEFKRVMGDTVKLKLEESGIMEDGQKISGHWVDKLVRVSMFAQDPTGTMRHEYTHQFMSWLNENGSTEVVNTLKQAATNKIVLGKLRILLKDHPAAIKQLEDPEEAVAYAFQFWNSIGPDGQRLLELGSKTETLFKKILRLFQSMFTSADQELAAQDHAIEIFDALSKGEFANQNDAAMQVINKKLSEWRDLAKARTLYERTILDNPFLKNAVFTNITVLHDTGDKYLSALGDDFFTEFGRSVKKGKPGVLADIKQTGHKFASRITALRAGLSDDKELFRQQLEQASTYLNGETPSGQIANPEVRAFVEGLRNLYQDMHKYAVDNKVSRLNEKNEWVPIGNVGPLYSPRTYDIDYIGSHLKEFTDKLIKLHPEELDALVEQAEQERVLGEHTGMYAASRTDTSAPITRETIANAIAQQLINTEGLPDHEITSAIGLTPYAAAVNKRSLNWIKADEFTEFMSKDVMRSAMNYVHQMVKRAEMTSAFGNGGEKIKQAFDRAFVSQLLGEDAVEGIEAAYAKQSEDLISKYGYSETAMQHHIAQHATLLKKTTPELKADFATRVARQKGFEQRKVQLQAEYDKLVANPKKKGKDSAGHEMSAASLHTYNMVELAARGDAIERIDGLLTMMKAEQDDTTVELARREKEGDNTRTETKHKTLRDMAKAKLKGSEEEKLAKIDKAEKFLSTPMRSVMSMEGTLGREITDTTRNMLQGMMAYQNVRLLPLTLFSSLVDPAGMIVNGAPAQVAFQGFLRGVREVARGWTGKAPNMDLIANRATYMGILDAGSYASAKADSMYGGSSAIRKVNDTFFRLNGMEAWNRAMRTSASEFALEYITKHLKKPNEHSERLLNDLGLDPKGDYFLKADFRGDDIRNAVGEDTRPLLAKKGDLDISNKAVQQAVMRWTDGAILNPNAAIRPIIASDPHYAIFYQFKSFVYAFQNTIINKAIYEAKEGNPGPMVMMCATYIPVMVAADLIRALLTSGGEEPAWARSLGGILSHGFERSGIGGIGQMVTEGLPYVGKGYAESMGLLGPQVSQVANLSMATWSPEVSMPRELARAVPIVGTTAANFLPKAEPSGEEHSAAMSNAAGVAGDTSSLQRGLRVAAKIL